MKHRNCTVPLFVTFSLAGLTVAQQPTTPTRLVVGLRAMQTTPAIPSTAGANAAGALIAPAEQLLTLQNPAANSPQDPAVTPKESPVDQLQQLRIQKIQAVRFDRRGAAILRMWATPAGEAPDAPSSLQIEGSPAAPLGAIGLSEIAEPDPGQVPQAMPGIQAISKIMSVASSATGIAIMAVPPTDPAVSVAPTLDPLPINTADATQPEAPALPDAFDLSLAAWRRAVTLGDWPAVKTFFADLHNDAEKKAAYTHLLNSLRTPPQDGTPQVPNQPPAMHRFRFDDVLGLITATPVALDDAAFASLGAILQSALQRGNLTESLTARLLAEMQQPEGLRMLSQRSAVKLLLAANLAAEAADFLPTLEDATAANDSEGLNLLARSLIARSQKDGKSAFLEQAWAALQANFAAPTLDKKQKETALQLAVLIAPRLKQELGKAWLSQSFTRDLQRGMDILASIGTAAQNGATSNANNAEFRKQTLQLQNTAIEALLAAAPERAQSWSQPLGILADNWLREAQQTYQLDQSASYFPQARRDRFGNFFYTESNDQAEAGAKSPSIKVADILDLQPKGDWLSCVEESLRPKFAMTIAQLWLKVQEETRAFPHIEELAKTHPKQARDLVHEFLKVWTRNHDPNAERRNYYFYGYEQRAEGIPLTRSKQQRNLAELAGWVTKLRTLPIGNLDESLLAQAFTTCHSSAEVYRLEAIQTVFGSLQELKPATLAALVAQMRGNLATVWRLPATQEKQKTKRKQKDIEQEVLRGYEVAQAVVDESLQKHDTSWLLLLARAALRHDENEFRRELGNDAKFSQRRLAAFDDFAAAATAYHTRLPELSREEESTKVFDTWFSAALGSSELAELTHEQVPDHKQIELIKLALQSLPGDAGERHQAMFASSLFTRMGALKPTVKFRYLKAGLAIVGEHKQAAEAKKLFDYYEDLVTEIKLETRVDGSTQVATNAPFGLFIDLRHTREIERESGGFGRYLRNQNDVSYSFNYGRPTENYRDKFQEMCKASLGEQFEIVSVTFQNENVHSRATEEYGWRITPYAYVLMKPRGPQIDRIPQLRLDLDFLDTSGYAVLPIESPTLAIDASKAISPMRPVADVELVQILDERQSKDGKLKLEIKAQGHGLMPALDQLAELTPADFTITSVEDSGPMVTRFDPDQANAIQSERTFSLSLEAKESLSQLPRSFTFGTPKIAGTKVTHQRYADADLVAAEATLLLDGNYGKPTRVRMWLALGVGLFAVLLGAIFIARRKPVTSVAKGFCMPDKLTPFTVIGLLREVARLPSVDLATQAELQTAIEQVEAGYFSQHASTTADLNALATTWVARANRSAG
ncbi:MAG: hypothetical protein EXS02_13380 [Planctomycetes bacterium]|nr:hypothetical protein [Planctomycetota bacterium]